MWCISVVKVKVCTANIASSLALFVILWMCLFQERLLVIVTPRYFVWETCLVGTDSIW